MSFFVNGDTMPPPLNVVVTPTDVIRLTAWAKEVIGGCLARKPVRRGGLARCSVSRCCYFEDRRKVFLEQDDEAYEKLMCQLILRYFNNCQHTASDDENKHVTRFKTTVKQPSNSTLMTTKLIANRLNELSEKLKKSR